MSILSRIFRQSKRALVVAASNFDHFDHFDYFGQIPNARFYRPPPDAFCRLPFGDTLDKIFCMIFALLRPDASKYHLPKKN
jgi:hypothetical protein